MMKKLAILTGAGLMALTGTAFAQSAPLSGTPASPFPYAAQHEVQMIDGRACRTIYSDETKGRVPVECADVGTTGSIVGAPVGGMAPAPMVSGGSLSGTPNSAFPYAAPHEVEMINGRPCRTVYNDTTKTRIPVECR
jgi:hypothetical protein